jgi:hypothetical protein
VDWLEAFVGELKEETGFANSCIMMFRAGRDETKRVSVTMIIIEIQLIINLFWQKKTQHHFSL